MGECNSKMRRVARAAALYLLTFLMASALCLLIVIALPDSIAVARGRTRRLPIMLLDEDDRVEPLYGPPPGAGRGRKLSMLSSPSPALLNLSGAGQDYETIAVVGFGSCSKHYLPQHYWLLIDVIMRYEACRHGRRYYRDGPGPHSGEQEPYEEHCRVLDEALPVYYNTSSQGKEIMADGDERTEHYINQLELLRGRHSAWGNPEPSADAFIWLGDIVYADTTMRLRGLDHIITALNESYHEFYHDPHYSWFRRSMSLRRDGAPRLSGAKAGTRPTTIYSEVLTAASTDAGRSGTVPSRIIGVWDDHDMGENDGGRSFPYHNHSSSHFWNFLEVDSNDPRRCRRGPDGAIRVHPAFNEDPRQCRYKDPRTNDSVAVYSFHTVTATDLMHRQRPYLRQALRLVSEHYEHLFCIILLDVRTEGDSISFDKLRGDLLGRQQWSWLDDVLRRNVSDYAAGGTKGRRRCAAVLIGSGIQFISTEKPTEQWGNFLSSRDRLLRLLHRHRIERALFISGDIHLLELWKDARHSAGHEGEAREGPRHQPDHYSIIKLKAKKQKGAEALKEQRLRELQYPRDLLGYPLVELTSSGTTHSTGRHRVLTPLIYLQRLLGQESLRPAALRQLLQAPATRLQWQLRQLRHFHYPASAPSLQPMTDRGPRAGGGSGWEPMLAHLIDGLFDLLFPNHQHTKVLHYLGRNFGIISLELRHQNASGVASRAVRPHPSFSLVLRLGGYALSLDEKFNIFNSYRYSYEYSPNSNVEEDMARGENHDKDDDGLRMILKYGRHHNDKAITVRQLTRSLQVVEYIQPLDSLHFDPHLAADHNSDTSSFHYHDHPRVPLKEYLFGMQCLLTASLGVTRTTALLAALIIFFLLLAAWPLLLALLLYHYCCVKCLGRTA